ncbi:MAG: ion transporter [Planctomycetia bacterium]|nr:ion transporter [Planctomycetia bacterium]
MKPIANPLLNDRFLLALILLNAGVIFLQCFYESNFWLNVLDSCFVACFLAEILFKIRAFTFSGYWQSGWNRFDFVVTLISSLGCLQWILPTTGWSSLEFIVALRVFRVFRFFRLLRFIPSIHSIVEGCKRAILASYVIVFAFLLVAFIFSIISCNLFKDVAPEYFRDPLTSFYTIFRLFTVEGWYEIPDAVASHYTNVGSFLTKLFFGTLLFVGGIIGMSFVNSIIVDAMVSDNNDDLKEQIRRLETKMDQLLEQFGRQE